MSISVEDHVREEARRTLAAYRAQPNLVREHVGIEDEVLSGGYGHRQIHELIQNAADAILESGNAGRVHLLLTREALYCANEGAPIDAEGIDAILNSHMSRKRGAQIGQFGIGFKSVLAISTRPEFHCRSGSFAFDADWSREQVRQVLPSVDRTPVLRLAKVLPPSDVSDDAQLANLMRWATTVVKLPRTIDGTQWISQDLDAFPREFLLFSPHVQLLTMDDQVTGRIREIATTHHKSRCNLRSRRRGGVGGVCQGCRC
ncbi:sacsin N-terminal ATP-binding-like domain-containing protein [Undibacterium arcticum]|uniref:sacsin N-terminal ATP-binding-like domain-containing protein n=1 Tax=Undibacterium arcticum TaxID=1762892 RepID=UPI0036230D69